jgi:hypothetical protein
MKSASASVRHMGGLMRRVLPFGFGGFLGGAVLDEFDADHEAFAAATITIVNSAWANDFAIVANPVF